MKTEQVNFRTTEKIKLKLLQKSQEYNMTLSDFVLGTAERECDLDVIQVWIHAYIDVITKWNRDGTILHYKTVEGDDAWSISAFKNTYFNRVELLEAWQECAEYVIDTNLPKIWDVLDNWDELVRRLKLLNMWEENNDIR